MAEPSQSKVINIPRGYSARQRKQIGEDVVAFIKRRTQSGIDVNGNLFASYSPAYGKTGTVDLTVSEQMLSNMKMLSQGPGFIRIGFDSADANNKAGYIQSPRGQKSGTAVREFVGISPGDLAIILERYPL